MLAFLLDLAPLVGLALFASLPLYHLLKWRGRALRAEALLAAESARIPLPAAPRKATTPDGPVPMASSLTPCMDPPAWTTIGFELERRAPSDPYAFGLGWVSVNGTLILVSSSLCDPDLKTNFALITGEPEHGKDVLIAGMLLPLLSRATPSQLRICFLDGTRADGALTRGLAHNWIEPSLDGNAIAHAMRAIRLERLRRERLLDAAQVTKWESLPEDVRPPLLLIIVSEITVLAGTLGKGEKIETWLDVELAAMRKCGMRAWLCTQNVSGMETQWRDKCSMKLGGYQAADRLCLPNLALTAAEIRDAGALPPPELIQRGMFTLVDKGQVLTMRTSYVPDEARLAAFRSLPQAAVTRSPELAVVQLSAVLNGHDEPSDERTEREVRTPAQLPPGRMFDELDEGAQCALIRAWDAAGMSGNEMQSRMRPIGRQRAQALIRQALGREPKEAATGGSLMLVEAA